MSRERRRGPRAETMQENIEHSREHAGESGMFGSIFTKEVGSYIPNDKKENEIAIIPFFFSGKKNSIFREGNPDMNKPFSKEQFEDGDTWDYKLTILTHRNVGVNKDNKVCPRTIKEECPYCEKASELRAEKKELEKDDKSTKEIEEEIRILSASKRAVYNVVPFDSKGKKLMDDAPLVWVSPHSSIEDTITERAKSKRSGEIKNFAVPSENWNIMFDFDKSKDPQHMYSGLEIVERKDEFSKDEIEDLLDKAICFEDILEVPTYDELYEALHGKEKKSSRREPIDDGADEDRGSRRRRGKESDDEPEERSSRRRGRTDEEEEESGSRRNRRRDKDDEGGKEDPECFGKDFNQLDECRDKCPDDRFERCMKESEGDGKDRKDSRRRR